MSSFSNEIINFERYGTYEYNSDEGGNFLFKNPPEKFNEQYISLPLINYNYIKFKIDSFYDIEFKEFISNTQKVVSSETTTEDISQLKIENEELQNKLQILIEKSDENITESERLAVKQVILDLRISLKQGVAERDFSDIFPYLPLIKK
jgi:hypothetical protein